MKGRSLFLSLVLTLIFFSVFVTTSAKSNKNVKRQATTSNPTSVAPTTTKPTTPKPTTTKPTTAKPTTVKPTTPKPTTVKPTTVKPTIVKPTTRKPTTMKPTTMKPTTMKPTTHKPTTMKPTTRKPTTMKPTTHKPTTAKPTTRPTTRRPMLTGTTKPTTRLPTTRKPTGTTKPTTRKPTATTKPTTRKPTATTKPTTRKPTSTTKPTTRKPTGTTKTTTRKPTGTTKPTTRKPTGTTKPTTRKPTRRPFTKPTGTRKPKPTMKLIPKVDPCAAKSQNNCNGDCLPFKYHLFNSTTSNTTYGGCASKKQSKTCNIMQKNRCAKKLGSGPSTPLLTVVSGCPPAGLFAELPCSGKEEIFKNKHKMTFKAKDQCAEFEVQTKQRASSTIFEVTATSTTSNTTAIKELLFTFSLKSGKKFTANSVWGLTTGQLSKSKNGNSVFIPGSPALLMKGQKRNFGFTLSKASLKNEYDFTITCKKTNGTAKGQKKSSYPIIMVVANYQEKSFKESLIYIFAQKKVTITETMIQVKVLPNKKRQTDSTLSVTINDPNGEASDTFLGLYNSNDPSIAASGLAIKSAAASADGTTPMTTASEDGSSDSNDDKGGVSTKVLIAVGVCAGVVIVALLIMVIVLVRAKRKSDAATAHQALYE